MKLKFSNNWLQSTLSNAAALCIAVAFFFLLANIGNMVGTVSWLWSMCSPFIYAFIIAYILRTPVIFFDRIYGKFIKKENVCRVLSTLTTYILAIGFISFIISIIIPQLGASITQFISSIPTDRTYYENLLSETLIFFKLDASVLDYLSEFVTDIFAFITSFLSSLLPNIVNATISISGQIYNAFFGFLLSIYLVCSREKFTAQVNKASFALLPETYYHKSVQLVKLIDYTFKRYVNSQALDALVVGVLCFIGLTVFGFEFALLIATVVCITNIIPMIGPFIGAIPGVLIILVAQGPVKALLFILFILVLQQIDGNILVPRIVGNSTGLSGFWVMFAILVGGGIAGIGGIIIAVPTFSIIYTLFSDFCDERIMKKEREAEQEEQEDK